MTKKPMQLPLDLGFRPASGREDFLVAPCNAAAVAWIDRFPDWPGSVAVLCGPEGSGKSHLLAVWSDVAKAVFLVGTDLTVDGLETAIGDAAAVAVDAADGVREPDTLFHLINMMRERGGHLLVAVREPPARWTFGTPDMRSRLAAAPLLELGAPDDAVLQAVMLKQFDDRRLAPGPDVLRYLTERMPRTFAAVSAVAAAMDRLSLAERRALTVPLARRVLAELGFDEE